MTEAFLMQPAYAFGRHSTDFSSALEGLRTSSFLLNPCTCRCHARYPLRRFSRGHRYSATDAVHTSKTVFSLPLLAWARSTEVKHASKALSVVRSDVAKRRIRPSRCVLRTGLDAAVSRPPPCGEALFRGTPCRTAKSPAPLLKCVAGAAPPSPMMP